MELPVDVPEQCPEGAPFPVHEPTVGIAWLVAALDGIAAPLVDLVEAGVDAFRFIHRNKGSVPGRGIVRGRCHYLAGVGAGNGVAMPTFQLP